MSNFGSHISIQQISQSHIQLCTGFDIALVPPQAGTPVSLSNKTEEGFDVDFNEVIEGDGAISCYNLYISESDNLTDLDSTKENGILTKECFPYSDVPITLSGLEPETEYWANVIVVDEYGLEAPYLSGNITTEDSGPIDITEETEIYIWFDSSGSMSSTLSPLETMRNTHLKETLLPFYNNDESLYDSKVTVENFAEDTFNRLATEPDNLESGVIHLLFQDEAYPDYHDSNFNDSERTSSYESDISNLRDKLDNTFPNNQYQAVIFQIATDGVDQQEDFIPFLKAVENGTGEYAPPYGLSDKSEVTFIYDVTPGGEPQYYADLIEEQVL